MTEYVGMYSVTVRSFEEMKEDRDRWRALAEYLCQNAPSVVVPDEIARLFPDLLLVVRGE